MRDRDAENSQISKAIAELRRGGVGTEANFRLIFDFYYRRLHGFFRRKTFSDEAADDLTQETFFQVYTKIEQFRGDAPFEAWLWQIAANIYRKKIERQNAQKRQGETISLDDESANTNESWHEARQASPLDGILQTEQIEQIRNAVGELPEQMRKCMQLRVFQDLSYEEIATLLRISAQTVKAHLFQARRRLGGRLGEYFDRVKI